MSGADPLDNSELVAGALRCLAELAARSDMTAASAMLGAALAGLEEAHGTVAALDVIEAQVLARRRRDAPRSVLYLVGDDGRDDA